MNPKLLELSQMISEKSSFLHGCNLCFFCILFIYSPFCEYPFGPEQKSWNFLLVVLISIIIFICVDNLVEIRISYITSTQLIKYLKNQMITNTLIPQESSKIQLVREFDKYIPIDPIVNIIHEYTTLPKDFVVLDLFQHDWEFYLSNWLKFELERENDWQPHVVQIKLLWSTNNQEIRFSFPIEFSLNFNRSFQIKHQKNAQAIKNLRTLNSLLKNYFNNSLNEVYPESFFIPIESWRLKYTNLSPITQRTYNMTIRFSGSLVQHLKIDPSIENELRLVNFRFDVEEMKNSPLQSIA